MSQDSIVTLLRYSDEIQAEMARSVLDTHGIASVVSRDDCGGLEPYLNVATGVRLLVHQGNEQAALAILEHPDTDPEEATDMADS